MKRNIIITSVIIGVVILAIVIYSAADKKDVVAQLEVVAQKGKFEVLVTTTGELQAENSEMIMGPTELRSRNLRFGNIRIQDLIAEGSVVDSGQWVATLDRTESENSLKDIEDALQKAEGAYVKVQLDTTITLRNLRDEIINLEFALEERKLALEQSKFEPPATIRQAEISLDRSQRALDQAIKNYSLRVRQSKEDMNEAYINLAQQQRRKQEMLDVLDRFVIRAPKSGMVIYHREWSGQRRTVGSTISPWDLTVATLPDLSSMMSRTYVNEIDISKIKNGQEVRIGVDAFPEKRYSGTVTRVANVGEQLPNTDAKVFEVMVKLDQSDPILRPGMTSSNTIVTNILEDVVYIPLEAIYVMDSIPYVYKKTGVRQVVVLGESNENQVVVEQGVEEGDKIYLTTPLNPERFAVKGEELIEVILEKREAQRRAEEERKRAEEERIRERDNRLREMRTNGNNIQRVRPGS
jgi:HlyD family secretion protein